MAPAGALALSGSDWGPPARRDSACASGPLEKIPQDSAQGLPTRGPSVFVVSVCGDEAPFQARDVDSEASGVLRQILEELFSATQFGPFILPFRHLLA